MLLSNTLQVVFLYSNKSNLSSNCCSTVEVYTGVMNGQGIGYSNCQATISQKKEGIVMDTITEKFQGVWSMVSVIN